LGCGTTFIGATGTAIGTGPSNTAIIVSHCGTGTAAQICDALILNGYSDWFLPSHDELNQMYIQRNVIGGFANSFPFYWSSTENDSQSAWGQLFDNGTPYIVNKSLEYYVRAVRAF